MEEKYLITGATGFIGSNIVRELVKRNKKVSVFIRPNSKSNWRIADLWQNLEVYRADLLDTDLGRLMKVIKPKYIFHLASYGVNQGETRIKRMVDINVNGTKNLLNSLKDIDFSVFINTGTCFEYGSRMDLIKESDKINPISDYARTKSEATLFCQKVAVESDLPIVNFRLFTPFGYYEDPKRLIPSIILSILSKKKIKLNRKSNYRNFIFIEDVVNAYIKTASVKKVIPGEIYNIASNSEHSVETIINDLIKITKSDSEIEWGAVDNKGYFESHWNANTAKAKSELDWAEKSNLLDCLEKTYKWFLRNKNLYTNNS